MPRGMAQTAPAAGTRSSVAGRAAGLLRHPATPSIMAAVTIAVLAASALRWVSAHHEAWLMASTCDMSFVWPMAARRIMAGAMMTCLVAVTGATLARGMIGARCRPAQRLFRIGIAASWVVIVAAAAGPGLLVDCWGGSL